MQAILLAGGLGTRLRSVVSDRPKPMALNEDRPYKEYEEHELYERLYNLKNFGIRERSLWRMI